MAAVVARRNLPAGRPARVRRPGARYARARMFGGLADQPGSGIDVLGSAEDALFWLREEER